MKEVHAIRKRPVYYKWGRISRKGIDFSRKRRSSCTNLINKYTTIKTRKTEGNVKVCFNNNSIYLLNVV